MESDRRRLLMMLHSGLLLSAASSLVSWPLSAATAKRQPAALLLPLSGASAGLGLSMRRAAALVQGAESKEGRLIVYDTAGTPGGAAGAAAQAVKQGVRMILGPLFSEEVAPVVAAARGRAPVIAFTNDLALRESGAFLFGITAAQCTGVILRYARSRGIRTVAMLSGTDRWSRQAAETATRLQGELGIGLTTLPPATSPQALLAAARAASGGALPDALFLPTGGEPFVAAARALRDSGVQLLGTLQAVDHAPASLAGAAGAWLAAPDPVPFGNFARTYESRHGSPPGTLSALAYDAAGVVQALQSGDRLNREGLLAGASFPGVAGAVRFRSDGSCARELAILIAAADGYATAESRLVA